MVSRAADYEWGSYHDACAGDRGAIAGYDRICRGRGRPWRELKALHRISLNMAAKDLAAREAEEEGLTPKSVPTLRLERKDALRFSRAAYHKGLTLEAPCGLPRRMRRCG